MFFAVLPPMPLQPRIICGFLGTIVTGILIHCFRRTRWRWYEWILALGLSPLFILAASRAGLRSGDRTEYVFLGALTAILCIRGSAAKPLPDFAVRALVVIATAAALGPVMGLIAHSIRFRVGNVELLDNWEIRLSLEDGMIAGVAGVILMALIVLGSLGLSALFAQRKPTAANEVLGTNPLNPLENQQATPREETDVRPHEASQ